MDLPAIWTLLATNASSGILIAAFLVLWRVQGLIDRQTLIIETQAREMLRMREEMVIVKLNVAKMMKLHTVRHPDDFVGLYAEERKS